MFDEFDREDDQWKPEYGTVGKTFGTVKKVLKYAFLTFVALFVGFLVLRIFLSNPPSSMKKAVFNEKLLTEYTSAKAEKRDFDMLKIPTSNSFSEDGFYSVYEIAYCPQAKQLQFTVRSNDRALNYLEKDRKGIKKLDEAYSYSLTLTSADSTSVISEYSYTCAERFGYTYRRLIFEDIDLFSVASVKLNIAISPNPDKTLQTVNIYTSSSSGNIGEIPDFKYDVPKKVTNGIKKKEITE